MAYVTPPMTPTPKPVEWFLVRENAMPARNGREGFTLGEIRYGVFDSTRICHTVEDEDRHLEDGNGKIYGKSAIPTGRYRLCVYPSPKHGTCILLFDVPGFKYAEIHAANHAEELRGCIACGYERLLDGVRNCQPALIGLIAELRRHTRNSVFVYLNVVRIK